MATLDIQNTQGIEKRLRELGLNDPECCTAWNDMKTGILFSAV